jgi:hypothetical protein
VSDAIAEGRAAWTRIRESGKTTFSDWMAIGGALLVLRAQAMRESKSNSCYGPRYQASINRLLDSNGLQDIDSHERRGAIIMVEHRAEIERWRNGLDEVARRRANHPNTIVAHWRRNSSPRRSGPKPKPKEPRLPVPAMVAVDGAPQAHGKPIHHSGEAVKRAAMCLRANWRNNDVFVVARLMLESAYRTDHDLLAIWPAHETSPPKAATVEEPAVAHA